MNCCCNYGAAVSGEWPEFECGGCPKHKGEGLAGSVFWCKFHKTMRKLGSLMRGEPATTMKTSMKDALYERPTRP